MSTNFLSHDQTVVDFISERSMQKQSRLEPQMFPKTPPQRKFSTQMRAVLLIFNADPYLMEAVTPFINFETESIFFDKILRLPFGSGHKAAARWAFAVWTDEQPKGNCFDSALSMSAHLQIAVLEALCLRWGLRG
jgi:hypothetical protein